MSKTLEEFIKMYQERPYLRKQGIGFLSKKYNTPIEIIKRAKSLYKNKNNNRVINNNTKILILDIETAPMKAYVWKRWKENISLDQTISEWFILCWSAKWLGNDHTYYDSLTPEEIKEEDDYRILSSLYNILDEADIVIAHNGCVHKDTPVLMKDFTWKKAGELKEGDELIAFEEGLPPDSNFRDKNGQWNNPLKGKGRQLKTATVTHNHIEKKHCVKVKFTNGYELITTLNHPWLMKTPKDNFLKWRESQDLKPGDRILRICEPWTRDDSYIEGWMSGFIEGEGSLIKNNDVPSAIQWCQRPTVVKATADKYADELNIPRFDYLPKANWGLGKGDCIYTNTLGGKWQVFKLLGKLNLQRLLSHINYDALGGLYSVQTDNTETETYYVQSVEYCGEHEIAALSTSTHTYIADGFAMHNSHFDIPKINSRLIINGFNPPSPYKQIDTLEVVKRQFGFSSNKLDALATYFGIENKDETDFDLWKRCLEGDKEAMDYMVKYNIKDVAILEKVYMRLRPWIKNHPNISLNSSSGPVKCSCCGSDNLEKIEDKTYDTNISKFPIYRCKNCGAISRLRISINNKPLTISV